MTNAPATTPARAEALQSALSVLDRLLDHSGARGSFDAMRHGDAVKDAEELLRSARSPGHTDLMVTPESIDAYMKDNPMEAQQDEGAATDDLVDRFAVALKAKLRAAGEKYGFDDAWKADDWRDKLIEDLLRHIQKGDPRDVAAYCAFAWHHDWSLSPKQDDLRSAAFTDRGAEDRYVSQDEGAAGDLKPCPFCGGEAEIIHLDDDDNAGGSCVCCTKCQASGNVEFGRKENFVENWNRRAHPSPPPAADEDRLRDGVLTALINAMPKEHDVTGPQFERITTAILAALKSTAAKEGEKS